jgi:hypothetical protein
LPRRASPASREAALLQDHIGNAFVEAAILRGDPLDYDGLDCDIYVDEIGVGRGVSDRLRELNYVVKPFNASKRATTEARHFTYANLRAEAYARLRDKMIRGEVGLPYSPELEQELRTARGCLNSNGKLQIIGKDDWRQIIHRSPDRLDAVMMAVAAKWFASLGATGDHDGPIAF